MVVVASSRRLVENSVSALILRLTLLGSFHLTQSFHHTTLYHHQVAMFRATPWHDPQRTRPLLWPHLQPPADLAAAIQRHSIHLHSQQQHDQEEGRDSTTSSQPQQVLDPIAFASGYSTQADLKQALQEAVDMAVASLPANTKVVDMAIVHVSSLYDGGIHAPATTVVPTIVSYLAEQHQMQLQHLIGSSVAGCISSAIPPQSSSSSSSTTSSSSSCRPVEWESVPAVSITLSILPDVQVESFVVSSSDVPDDFPYLSPPEWNRAIGLPSSSSQSTTTSGKDVAVGSVFWLLPSPAFAIDVDTLVQGIQTFHPQSQIVGGVASTVSSLSRAKLYHWKNRIPKGASTSGNVAASVVGSCYSDGCVGLKLYGDIHVQQMTAQGAKPVGGIYQILKAQESTISVIVLDEIATDALPNEEVATSESESESEEQDDNDEDMDERQKRSQFYAKARIPKPVLAEANFLMRTLSDDDQAFMRRQLLVGLEQGGTLGRTASELQRLANGEGHRFAVHPVASAGMKDGSVTLPLGSVNVQPGTRLRFFVRESDFAKKEVEALWMGYKKRVLTEQFAQPQAEPSDSTAAAAMGSSFTPAACFVVPTLDRGNKFFLGKPGYESGAVAKMLPGISCISGFFSNGVIGRMDVAESSKTGVQGSASGYFLLGAKNRHRPVYSPTSAAAEALAQKEQQEAEELAARVLAAEDLKRKQRAATASSNGAMTMGERAPRSPDGELILKRREVHSGRALTVSTVEWSVAEKLAKPTSALEGFMWEKETEVDRFRERVPLANLVSQCRVSAEDPTIPKPRDWVGPLKQTVASKGFVIVPECKRMEPTTGSLRRRYDIPKLIRDFTLAGVPVISVNCDSVLFGGSLDDITKARQAATSAAVEGMSEDGVVVPAILASDLILYPYQLYKLRLAGADAVNLVAGALASKDLLYLTKIASSLQLQTLITVTSEVQLQGLLNLNFDGLIVSNRELEDYSFDSTGQQALHLLKSETLQELRQRRGLDFPVLVEGRVGIIERPDSSGIVTSTHQYVKELKDAGASGAIVAGGLASRATDSIQDALTSLLV